MTAASLNFVPMLMTVMILLTAAVCDGSIVLSRKLKEDVNAPKDWVAPWDDVTTNNVHHDYHGTISADTKRQLRELTIRQHRRRLGNVAQKYGGSGIGLDVFANETANPWYSLEAGKKVNPPLVGPLRVHFETSLLDLPSDQLVLKGMCPDDGLAHEVDPCKARKAGSCKVTCKPGDRLTTGRVKFVKAMLNETAKKLKNLFEVKQVQGILTMGPANNEYGLVGTDYPNTDVVIVITLHPTSDAAVAGYAYSGEHDQFGLTKVGYYNWVPSQIDDNPVYTTATTSKALGTCLHEALHVLGGIKKGEVNNCPTKDTVPDPSSNSCSDTNMFRDALGFRVSDNELFIDEPQSDQITKVVRKWRSKKVLETAKKQFNCSDLTGVPLEDVNLGKFVHWEARLFGGEVMCYGIGSSETYLGDITLAFFEDTNQYLVNYSAAGRVWIEEEAQVYKYESNTFIDKSVNPGPKGNLTNYTPGYHRWGRHQGCDFIRNKPVQSWSDQYACKEADAYQCTPDFRMSAQCYLTKYDSSYPAERYATCDASKQYNKPCIDNLQYPGIDTAQRYFSDSVGGFSSAMDYAPVYLGYWNCQDDNPVKSISFSYDEATTDFGTVFESAQSNMQKFGGQVFTSTSRCFKSSLISWADMFLLDPSLPTYGLCYQANCYSMNYLQFGIKITGQKNTVKWYACTEAGKKYIPGFFGAFHCPEPKVFCDMLGVSGILYPQVNPITEWIFWAVLLGVLFIVFIILCCCKKIRQCVAHGLKACCGFRKRHREKSKKKRTPESYCLYIFNIIWIIVGFGAIACGIMAIVGTDFLWDTASRQAPHLIGIGLTIMFISLIGVMSARQDKPTLKVLVYFNICVFILIVVVFLIVLFFATNEFWIEIWNLNWATFKLQFPDSFQKYNSTEALNALADSLTSTKTAPITYSIIGFIGLSIIISVICGGIMLWWKNIIGTMVVVLGLVIFSGGVVWIALISLYYSKLPIPWFIPALVPGILLTITGFLGLFSGNCSPKKPKRSFGVLIAFMFFSAIVALAFVGGGLAIFFLKDDIYQTVDGWSVVVLDTFTKSLKLSSMVDSCNFNGDGLLHNGPIKSGAWLQNNTNVAANVTTTNATTTTIATATIEAITTILISRPNISLGSGNSTIEGSEKCLRIAVKNWLSLNLQAIAIVLLVISAIILASFVAAILVHKWNTRDNEKQEHEEKGMEMPEIRDNDKPYCDSDDDLEQPQPVTPNPLHKRIHDNDPYANNNPQGDVHV